MKKIVSLVLILTMMLGILAVNSSAAIQVQSNFNDMTLFTANFHAGAYYTEDNLLFGYSEAKCLQSKSEWYVYDTSCTVSFADDELSDSNRAFSLWYCNINLEAYGRWDGTNYMVFGYDIDNQQFYLTTADYQTGEVVDLVDKVPYEIKDDEFYTFGLSVTRGRLRGFINDQLVVDFVDTNDNYLIGLKDECTNPTPLVFWNDGNFIQYKDVKISTAEYLYPATPVNTDTQTTAAQADGTTATTKPVETTTRIEQVEVTDKEGNTVTDDSGNKVTETVVITDAPVADTNTGAVQGGSSTSTGDKAVIVVAAMVVTLGCAIIVKKVNA